MNLALVDIDNDNLSRILKTDFGTRNADAQVKTYTADVSKSEDWLDLRAKVEMDFGLVGFLMLNAGIGPPSSWEDLSSFHKVSTLLPTLHPLASTPPPTK